jgi:hypothetical protein
MGCQDTPCGKIKRGASGLAKFAAQSIGIAVDDAPPDVVRRRRDECRGCDFATRNPAPKFKKNNGLTSLSQCSVCKCFIAAKTKVASESCPLPVPRWEAATASPRQSS